MTYSVQPSLLHLAGTECVSWYKLVSDWFYYAGLNTNMILPRNQEIGEHAPRGRNLGLDVRLSEKLGFHQYGYLDGIREMISE